MYPAYMSDASPTNQEFELMLLVFGISHFVTLVLLVTRMSKYGESALALAVLTTAVGRIISVSSRSILSFAASIAVFGLSSSVFYPVSVRLVTMNTPSGHLVQNWESTTLLFWRGVDDRADSGRICIRRVSLRQPLSCVVYHRKHILYQRLQYLEKAAIIFRHKVLVWM